MAITDPGAVAFCNNQARHIADRLMQSYWLCKQAVADFTSKSLAATITNDASVVLDGSATDGRTPITGADVNVLLGHMNTLIADFEASTNVKRNQIQKIAVNET